MLAGAVKGDEGSFRLLYRATQPQLLRYLRDLVGPNDAEDVAAEAWLRIARSLTRFDGTPREFRAWSFLIARNRAVVHLERRRPVLLAPTLQLPETADPADPARIAERTESTHDILAQIKTLPREQARAVLLRVVIGLDTATTARVLGKRPDAVRTNTHRGLRNIARHLAAPDSHPPSRRAATVA